MNPRPSLQRGVTIVELLIVITIGGILAAIAVPSFRDVLNNQRQSSAMGLLVSDVNQARGEAIKRNLRVLVCVREQVSPAPADPATALTHQCAASTDWRLGWVVCISDAAGTQCVAPTGAPNPVPNPILVRPALDRNLTLTATDVGGATGLFRFLPNSTSAGAVTMTLSGVWAGAAARLVCIGATGNISRHLAAEVCP